MIGKVWLFVIMYITTIQCKVLVPERGNVSEFSTKFLEYARFYISRVSRRSPYLMNLEGLTKHQWGNNITLHIVFYEYLHNEYRRSFVEIHARSCDFVSKDPLIGSMLKNYGIVCPSDPGEYRFLNMSLPLQKFPYLFPFDKFRVNIEIEHTDTKELVGKGYMYGVLKYK